MQAQHHLPASQIYALEQHERALNNAISHARTIQLHGQTLDIPEFTEQLQALLKQGTLKIVQSSKYAVEARYEINEIQHILDKLQRNISLASGKKLKPAAMKPLMESITSSLSDLSKHIDVVQHLNTQLATIDLQANLDASEHVATLLNAFEAQQMQLHISLIDAMRFTKRIKPEQL